MLTLCPNDPAVHALTKPSCRSSPTLNSAQVLATSSGDLRWQLLPVQLFTNGWAYRGRRVRPPLGATPFIAHQNWMSGGVHKRRRMGDWGMWALEDDGNGTDVPTCRGDHAAVAAARSRTAK